MTNLIKNFLNDEAGASAAEYALILAVVGIGIATAGIALGDAISGAIQGAADIIDAGNPA